MGVRPETGVGVSNMARRALSVIFAFSLFLTLHAVKLKMLKKEELLNFGTNVGGSSHPCFRRCNGAPMRCEFNFTISPFSSLSVHCGKCPWDINDCVKPGCIPAGGTNRPVHVANLMLPGPSIQVCHGDEVVVRVDNAFENEAASIHWHGQWMVGTQYMDGVPYITQCPQQPNNQFVYTFTANPHGTHMWHAHIGFLDSDGLFGPLVVRRPPSEEPFINLYDEDLPEHAIVFWHWYPSLTADYLPLRLQRNQTVSGAALLVNGKGPILPVENSQGNSANVPWEVIEVDQGKRYRLRLIFNSAVYCPVHVSIDNHTMLAIATDGADFSPVEADSLMMNAGERWDVVVTANQPVSSYWVRIRARGDCGETKTRVHQQAILRYRGSHLSQPSLIVPDFSTSAPQPGRILNPMQVVSSDYTEDRLVHVTELLSIENSPHGDISGIPDHTLYTPLDFKYYDELTAPGPYPQMNNMTFEYPSQPMLVLDGLFCTKDDVHKHCLGSYCSCPYTEVIKLGALVEIVLTDLSTDREQDHPYHLHGTNFHVVAEKTLGAKVRADLVVNMNENGNITKRFSGAPLKDTVTVPSQGFVIIRFRATNPGYWMFHCHVSNHLHLGMAMVLRVGEHSDFPPVPDGFPQCGNYKFDPERKPSESSGPSPSPSFSLRSIMATIMLQMYSGVTLFLSKFLCGSS